ncbi:hypothetical protein I4U23_011797 [Adineta vaga]|nr:hypothetical protein I4U23_011797 [Adineta vaga]
MSEILFARAKTSLTLDQLDAKRKWYLIKFLYDSQLLYDKKLGMKYIDLSGVDLSDDYTNCDLSESYFQGLHIATSNRFKNVDLQQSYFDDMSDSRTLQLTRINLIGSNLNIANDKITRLTDSFLPNGTFKTSFIPFGMILIENGDAEQGKCYHFHLNLTTNVPSGWKTRSGDVSQIFYNNSKTRCEASVYLGGFADEQSSTSLKISFKNTKNKIEYIVLGPINNNDRHNQTTLLYCSYNATIPNDRILIDFELKFHRQKSQNGLRLGMADNLKFIIQQK